MTNPTPDPTPDLTLAPPPPPIPTPFEPDPPRRIPNPGHALLFLALSTALLLVFQLIVFGLAGYHAPKPAPISATNLPNPKLLLASETAAYFGAIALSALLFPRLWRRPFFEGIQWNWRIARHLILRLIPLGLALAFTAQAAVAYTTPPKTVPIEQMFRTPADAWLITLFGIFLAPAFEEITFRGFLFPAFAIAYDWLSLPRTPDALDRWRSTTTLTPIALVFSAICTSLLFTLLHGPQVGWIIPMLAVLFTVSLVLTWVRLRTRSVACSTLVHAAYNSLVFLLALIQTGGYRHLEKLIQ